MLLGTTCCVVLGAPLGMLFLLKRPDIKMVLVHSITFWCLPPPKLYNSDYVLTVCHVLTYYHVDGSGGS